MERKSTISRLHKCRPLRITSKRGWLLCASFGLLVILDAWGLQAQSAAARSRTSVQPQSVYATSGESHVVGGDEAAKKQNRPTPTTASQPSAQASSLQTNLPPKTAIVTWDSQGLEIDAWNSSLIQILHDVTAKTGARVEGLTRDQRIFGKYGPGPGYDVLSSLLEGSDYNLLMFGSHGAHPPLTIVLSARLPLTPHTSTKVQMRRDAESIKPIEPDRQADNQPAPASSLTNQDPYNIGGPPRDPVQSMQEILQRQQLIDQQTAR